MRKYGCALRALLLLLIVTVFVGVFPNTSVFAMAKKSKGKAGSQNRKAKLGKGIGKGKGSARQVAGRGKASVGKRGKRIVTARGRKSRGRATALPVSSKRGRVSARADRKSLSRSREARRRRARAIYMARVRAIRARDEALRNIAASNISMDNAVGEDPEIRAAAINALRGRSGTVVVMDPTNGRVFSVVNQHMALGSPVKPCSTVKLIVGLASLHEGVFDPNTDVQISSRASMHLTDALAKSNNPVFQVLGRMLGYERVVQYAANFGFGERTGVNFPGESEGFLPEEGEQETGHMSSHGDGFGVTAMQLAAFTGAIANGGNLYLPRIPRSEEEAENFRPFLKRRIEMSPEDRLRLMAGMIGAVNYGTGKLAYNTLAQVAGKTGTCTGSRDKLGLFTSFSSVETPRLVITVITTGSTEAGKRAAEIAGRVYNAISPRFFRDRLLTPVASAESVIENGRK